MLSRGRIVELEGDYPCPRHLQEGDMLDVLDVLGVDMLLLHQLDVLAI
jgi:hypothetical protein